MARECWGQCRHINKLFLALRGVITAWDEQLFKTPPGMWDVVEERLALSESSLTDGQDLQWRNEDSTRGLGQNGVSAAPWWNHHLEV